MAVETQYQPMTYKPGAAMSPEAIPFEFLNVSDVTVVHVAATTGIRTPMVSGTNFAIEGDGAAALATVRALQAWPEDDDFVVERSTVIRQEARTPPHQPLPSRDIERQLDRQALVQQEALIAQRLETDSRIDLSDRAILLPPGEIATVLPPAETRRGDSVLSVDPVTKQMVLRPSSYFATGPRGPNGYAAKTLDQLRAAPVTDGPLNYDRAPWEFIEGDYSDAPVGVIDVFVVESDFFPLSTGAWVRQSAGEINFDGRSIDAKLMETVSVTDTRFAGGARGDGVSDDTASLNAAFAYMGTLGGGQLFFPPGTYLVSEETNATMCSNVRFVGPGAWIKAADDTDFAYVMSLTSTTDVLVDQLSFDANKDGRLSSVGFLRCLVMNFGQRITVRDSTFKSTLGIVAEQGASAVALVASGGVQEILVDGCKFLDCGLGPSDRPSDAVFIRGNNCKITNCYAENITDHAYVLEGCNYSQIVNCEAKNCTSIAAISNDTNADCRGNLIHGITGTIGFLGSFGGAVGAYAGLGESTGALKDCRISNINLRAEDDCEGGGAGLFFYGKIQNIEVSNVRIDAGESSGAMNHACIIDCAEGLEMSLTIKNSEFRGDGAGAGVRLLNHANGVVLEGNRYEDGSFGVFASDTSQFIEKGSTFVNCDAKIGLSGTANYYGTEPQTWPALLASDAGDAAASFDGAPLVTRARISRRDRQVSALINASLTIGSVALNYITVDVPSWATAESADEFFVGGTTYDGVAQNFLVRPMTDGTWRIYRSVVGNTFAPGSPVTLQFSIQYEAAE